jgi:hypothetical protein
MGFWSRCTVNDNVAMSETRSFDTAVGDGGLLAACPADASLVGAPHLDTPESTYRDAFARRLRCVRYAHVAALEIRTANGSSQESVAIFAALLGIPPATLLAYECGLNDPPAAFLIRLRDITDASIDWLLTGTDES